MRLFGHRGAMNEAPDSTLEGFRHALALGLDAVEFDVQLTADNELIILHDNTLDRTTNASGPVSDRTLAELRDLNARAQFTDWPESCVIPTLAEVLDVVGGMAELLVEIKRDTPARLEIVVPATIALLQERGVLDRVRLSSFDPIALEIAHRVAPDLDLVINGVWREPGLYERVIEIGVTGTDFDHKLVGREHLDWARAHNLWIIGWPGNTEADLRIHQEYGLDNMGTDAPSTILPLLPGPTTQVH